jgi:hypothetical protein
MYQLLVYAALRGHVGQGAKVGESHNKLYLGLTSPIGVKVSRRVDLAVSISAAGHLNLQIMKSN